MQDETSLTDLVVVKVDYRDITQIDLNSFTATNILSVEELQILPIEPPQIDRFGLLIED